MDLYIALILVLSICIVAIGAIRLKRNIEDFAAATTDAPQPATAPQASTSTSATPAPAPGAPASDQSLAPTLARPSVLTQMVLDSNTPIIKNEIIAGKKLGVGASLEMSSTDSAGVFNVGGDSIFSMKRGGYLGVGTLVPSTSIDINSMTGKNSLAGSKYSSSPPHPSTTNGEGCEEEEIGVLEVGGCVGEAAILLNHPHTFSAKAITPVHVYVLPREALSSLCKLYPTLGAHISKDLVEYTKAWALREGRALS
jgi:hypothetical protein